MRKVLILAVILTIASSQRLPAPVIEESQTPAPEEETRPKSRHPSKPKPAPRTSEQPPAREAAAPVQRFAGTWKGTVEIVDLVWGGHREYTIQIDSTERFVSNNEPGGAKRAPATITGNSISWQGGWFGAWTWTLVANPDGQTAQLSHTGMATGSSGSAVRLSRTASASAAPASAPSTNAVQATASSGEIPVAKAVPGKPGFVYSPFDPNETRYLDVRGRTTGTKIKDPATGRLFIIP